MKKNRLAVTVLLVCVMLLSIAGTVYAGGYIYGQYNMAYLPGTTGTVTNMPGNETGLTPGAGNPYIVPSTVPVREGFEFIDWTLAWGTMDAPTVQLTYYIEGYTFYLDIGDGSVYAYGARPEDESIPSPMTGIAYGSDVTLAAQPTTDQNYLMTDDGIEIPGTWAFSPNRSGTLQEGWNTQSDLLGETVLVLENMTENTTVYGRWVFTPDKVGYTVRYLEYGNESNEVASEKNVTNLEAGSTITESAIEVEDYRALDPTEITLTLNLSGNEIIFWYEKVTNYTVQYLDIYTSEPVGPPRTMEGLPVGTSVTEWAMECDGYIALDEELTLVLAESGNKIIFWYIPKVDD